MTPSRPLTLATLKAKGACVDQRAKFRRLFGKSVDITEALCAEHAATFSWAWAADNLLSDSARATYDAAVAPAQATYDAVVASARATYNAAVASARATHNAAVALAWATYDAAVAPAQATYDAAVAPAWARAYINDVGDAA